MPSDGHAKPGAWALFWVGDEDGARLRMFETLFTLTYCLWMGYCFLHWEEWLTEKGFHLNADESRAMRYFTPFPLLDGPRVAALGIGIAAASVCLMTNLFRGVALLGLFASALYVQGADYLATFTLNKLYIAVFGILLLNPGYRRDGETGRMSICRIPVRVIQATLILQYLASGIGKAFGGDWLESNDVLLTQVQGLFRTDFAAWCLQLLPAWTWTVMQWTALLFELEAPLLFCVKALRPVAFVVGIGFHLMIALMMKDLIFFSAQMWTFYALFVTPEEWRAIGRRLRLSMQEPKRLDG